MKTPLRCLLVPKIKGRTLEEIEAQQVSAYFFQVPMG